MSLLDQDTIKKGHADKTTELEEGDNKDYEVKAIYDSGVYDKESDSSHHLLDFYYLVLWKSYPREKNTWESVSAV